jgi:hypothetical protein
MRTLLGTRDPPAPTARNAGPWSVLRARIYRTLHRAPENHLADASRELALRSFEARTLALSMFGSVDYEAALLFGAGGSLPRHLLDYFEPTARALIMLRAICADMEPTDFPSANCGLASD